MIWRCYSVSKLISLSFFLIVFSLICVVKAVISLRTVVVVVVDCNLQVIYGCMYAIGSCSDELRKQVKRGLTFVYVFFGV